MLSKGDRLHDSGKIFEVLVSTRSGVFNLKNLSDDIMKNKFTQIKHHMVMAAAVGIVALAAQAEIPYDFQEDGIYYRITSASSVSVGYGDNAKNSYSGSVVIPSTVTHDDVTYTVTAISDSAFTNCTKLTSITIPRTVRTIGVKAFNSDSKLATVNIEDLDAWLGIDFLGTNVYANPARCSGDLTLNGEVVTEVTFPDTTTVVKAMVLANCKSISKVTLPQGVKKISKYAFYGNEDLLTINLPEGLEELEANAFYNCYTLPSVTLPESLKKMGKMCFYQCKELESINIPKQIEVVDTSSFMNCHALKDVTLPSSLSEVRYRAFAYCEALPSANLPENVRYIGTEAYTNSTGITEAIIPAMADSVSYAAFSGCKALKKLTIADSSETLTVYTSSKKATFASCPIDTIYYGRNVTSICTKNGDIKAFNSLTSVKVLTVGEQVTDLTEFNGEENTGLERITCLTAVPPTVNEFATATYETAKLIVPAGAKAAYEAADVWKNFSDIQEETESGIDEITTETETSENSGTTYYDLHGVRIAQPSENGIYIKVQNGKAEKILITK